ncbi:hypothetical protein Tco_1307341, partial [Tanacetum coccineum]
LPTPKGKSCGNYSRCVNQILQNLNNMQLWLRIPLAKSDDDDAMMTSSGGTIVKRLKTMHKNYCSIEDNRAVVQFVFEEEDEMLCDR